MALNKKSRGFTIQYTFVIPILHVDINMSAADSRTEEELCRDMPSC